EAVGTDVKEDGGCGAGGGGVDVKDLAAVGDEEVSVGGVGDDAGGEGDVGDDRPDLVAVLVDFDDLAGALFGHVGVGADLGEGGEGGDGWDLRCGGEHYGGGQRCEGGETCFHRILTKRIVGRCTDTEVRSRT